MSLFQSISLLLALTFIHPSFSKFIDCMGTDECFNETITCPTNQDCTIQCNGNSSCSFSTIICPTSQSAKCAIICNSSSCDHTIINAQNTSTLNIHSNGYKVLSYSSIYCPSNPMHSSCNITYIGDQYGLNNINIYTLNTYTSIHIECNSMNKCWSNDNNPILHYGDITYSQKCMIYDSNTCKTNDILIADDIDPLNEGEVSTKTVSSTSTIVTMDNGDSDNVLTDQYDADNNNNNNNKYDLFGWNNALILILIGMFCGILVSLCCFCVFCIHRNHNKSQKLQIPQTNNKSMKRTVNYKLSPSLKQLSPRLTPTIIELPDNHRIKRKNPLILSHKTSNTMNSLQAQIDMHSLPNPDFLDIDFLDIVDEQNSDDMRIEGDGITVIVEKYENGINDEVFNSPTSTICNSTNYVHSPMSLKDIHSVKSLSDDNNMNIIGLDKETDGMQPDEFVICGDDEDDTTPC